MHYDITHIHTNLMQFDQSSSPKTEGMNSEKNTLPFLIPPVFLIDNDYHYRCDGLYKSLVVL